MVSLYVLFVLQGGFSTMETVYHANQVVQYAHQPISTFALVVLQGITPILPMAVPHAVPFVRVALFKVVPNANLAIN
jgi:hypothetical protein